MKKYAMSKDYDNEELEGFADDILVALNNLDDECFDNQGDIKGKVRIQVIWCSEDDCECTGFQHRNDCPHWVLPY